MLLGELTANPRNIDACWLRRLAPFALDPAVRYAVVMRDISALKME